MSIHFTNVNQLKKLLDQVAPLDKATERQAASSCVLVEQISFDTTSFTTWSPGKASHTQKYIHNISAEGGGGGEENVRFLIDFDELQGKINRLHKARVRSITMRLTPAGLTLIADLSIRDGQEVKTGNLRARLYAGAWSDFEPPAPCAELVTEMDSASFKDLIGQVKSFSFSKLQHSEGNVVNRTLLLAPDIETGKVEAIANHEGARIAFIKMRYAATNHFTTQLGIDGTYTKQLASITSGEEPVNILQEEREGQTWLTFAGNSGQVTIQYSEPELRTLHDQKLFEPDCTFGPFRLVTEAMRRVSLNSLSTAVKMQLPSGAQERKDLLIAELDGELVITHSQDIAGTERSMIPSLDYESPEALQPWQPLVLSGEALASVTAALERYIRQQAIETSTCEIWQRTINRPDGSKSWLLIFQSFPMSISNELKLMIACNSAHDVQDLLDTND